MHRSHAFKNFKRALNKQGRSNSQARMPHIKTILNCPEYREAETRTKVLCEVVPMMFTGKSKSEELLSLKVFKLYNP